MKTPEIISLPQSQDDYNQSNEQLMRRTVEQTLGSIRNDIVETAESKNKQSSLSSRRNQFLLMGG